MVKTIGVKELSVILHKAPRTIIEDLTRRPGRFPRPLKLWLADNVDSWLIMREGKVRK